MNRPEERVLTNIWLGLVADDLDLARMLGFSRYSRLRTKVARAFWDVARYLPGPDGFLFLADHPGLPLPMPVSDEAQ